MISLLYITLINFPMFFSDNLLVISIIALTGNIFSFTAQILNTCIIGETIKDIFALYFLLDTIGVSKFSAIVGLIGMLSILMPPDVHIIMLSALHGINIFLLGGNFRIILAYCEYKRWQVLICKLSIGLCCIIYMSIGAYFMRNSFHFLPVKGK